MTYKTLSYCFGICFNQYLFIALRYYMRFTVLFWFRCLMVLFILVLQFFGLNCRKNMRSITFSVPLCIQVSHLTLDTTMHTSRSLSTYLATLNIRYS